MWFKFVYIGEILFTEALSKEFFNLWAMTRWWVREEFFVAVRCLCRFCTWSVVSYCKSCVFLFLFVFPFAFLCDNHNLWLPFSLFFLRIGWLVDFAVILSILVMFLLKHDMFICTSRKIQLIDWLRTATIKSKHLCKLVTTEHCLLAIPKVSGEKHAGWDSGNSEVEMNFGHEPIITIR